MDVHVSVGVRHPWTLTVYWLHYGFIHGIPIHYIKLTRLRDALKLKPLIAGCGLRIIPIWRWRTPTLPISVGCSESRDCSPCVLPRMQGYVICRIIFLPALSLPLLWMNPCLLVLGLDTLLLHNSVQTPTHPPTPKSQAALNSTWSHVAKIKSTHQIHKMKIDFYIRTKTGEGKKSSLLHPMTFLIHPCSPTILSGWYHQVQSNKWISQLLFKQQSRKK